MIAALRLEGNRMKKAAPHSDVIDSLS
jgi:hypothetical protein